MTRKVARRNIRIGIDYGANDRYQVGILRVGVGLVIRPLEFNTNRVVVARGAPAKAGFASVPRTPAEGYELNEFAIAAQQQVG